MDWFGNTAPAYGLAKALELWQKAEIVHIKGWEFLHTGDEKFQKFPCEFWVDRRNGCFRDMHPSGWHGDYTTDEPTYSLTVSDGQYIMKTIFRGDRGTVEFTKLSPFQQRLQTRTIEPFPAFMANPENVEGFARVGQERIKNRVADIWEGEITGAGKSIPYKKLRIWLLQSTGEIVRVFRWTNAEEDAIRWLPRVDADTIKYNVTPPADCFKTDPPEGYELRNTKETAIEKELCDDGRVNRKVRFYGCIGFTLNDGSVIFGWHANHAPEESQAHFFENLKPGGALPKLPAKIVGLKPWPVEEEITCVGRHLAWTQKRDKFYEWGIYVANRQMPERDTFQDYKVVREYDGIEPRRFRGAPNRVGQALTVGSEEEFDTWVRGAMAELSDEGNAPEHVTYQNALELAERIRSSLNE